MITLKSSDNEIFEVEEAVAAQSEILGNLIKDDCADGTIPLQKVPSRVLAFNERLWAASGTPELYADYPDTTAF